MRTLWHLFIFFSALLTSNAQVLTNGQRWEYQLIEGSAYMEDTCPDCVPPDPPIFGVDLPKWQPLYGSFELVATDIPGLFAVTNFVGLRTNETVWTGGFWGSGKLLIDSNNAILEFTLHQLFYDIGLSFPMTNVVFGETRQFPMISVRADQSNGDSNMVRRLRIFAAPISDIWFSTESNFTDSSNVRFSHEDILSTRGRIVKHNADLTKRFSFPPGELGLHAFDIGAKGEIYFSASTNGASVASGDVRQGDIVTSAGRVPFRLAQLLAAFNTADADASIDGLQVISPDEIYFSLRNDIARAGNSTLRRGDILSSKGRVVASEASLYENWAFFGPEAMWGVGPFYVWPSGEVWFFPQESFGTSLQQTNNIVIIPSDMISSRGYIVYRSETMLQKFAWPLRFRNVDAFTVISDFAAVSTAPVVTNINAGPNELEVEWSSDSGRAFRLESTGLIEGYSSFVPTSDISPDQSAKDPYFFQSIRSSFYRVRQW